MNRSHKRHPQTHLPDVNMVSDLDYVHDVCKTDFMYSSGSMYLLFFSYHIANSFSFHVGNPEGIHELLHLFSDRGTPQSVRFLNSYSGHTYKFTKEVSLNPSTLSNIGSRMGLGWLFQIYQDPYQITARSEESFEKGGSQDCRRKPRLHDPGHVRSY